MNRKFEINERFIFNDFIAEKLKFSPPPVNKKLELGSVGKIHCKAQGGTSGSPTVRWIKIKHANKLKDIKIDSADSLPSHVDDVNGTLLFNSVQSEDAGMYTCIAKDGDELINATIKVEVVGKYLIFLFLYFS